MKRSRWWGWLTLLSISGLIYWILTPIFFSSTEKPHERSCLSNRKIQGLALIMYVQDYDERFPHRPDLWATKLYPYTKSEAVLQCPSLGDIEYGTAFDSRLAGRDSITLADSEKTLAIFESTNRAKNATSPGTGFSTRHNGIGIVVFADGNAKHLNREAFDALPAPGWKESKVGEAKKVAEDAKR